MEGPWEQFSPTPSPSEAPVGPAPWEQFSAPKPEPDLSPWKNYVKKNIDDHNAVQAEKRANSQGTPDNQLTEAPHPAQDVFDAMQAGWQMSISGLLKNRKMPDTVLPEHADMAMRIMSQAGQIAGDIPAMVTGAFFGGAAGSEVPVIGTAAGAAGGAFALPAAMRKTYVDMIQKGEVSSFGDFFERVAGSMFEGVKAGTIGILTEGAGNLAMQSVAAPATQAAAKFAAQLGTMTTVGKAMEGEVPSPMDFFEGALVMAGLHGTVKLASEVPTYAKNIQNKLHDIYAQTGIKPTDVAIEAQSNPVLRQEILSSDPDIPRSYQSAVEPPQKNQELIASQPKVVDAKVPEGMLEQSPVLNSEFNGESKPQILVDPKDAILDRVGQEAPKEKQTWSQLYTRTLDDLNPVKQLTRALTGDKELPVGADPFKLMREARAYGGIGNLFIDHGPREFSNQAATGTPGLRQIFSEFKGDLEGFKAYAIGARAVELEAQGIKTGIPIEKAKEYVEVNKGKYDSGFRKFVTFQNDVLRYLKDSEVVSESLYNDSTANHKNYVPFNRIQETGKAGGGKSASSPIKTIYGSDLKLADPIEQVIKNTYSYIKIAEQNRAKLALVKIAEQTEAGKELVKKVKAKMTATTVGGEELKNLIGEINGHLDEHGIEGIDPEGLKIFRPLSQPLAKDEIAVMREGKREVYKVGVDVATALNATDYRAPNLVLKTLSIPTKVLRVGAVETADFLTRHFIRDTVNAYVLSKNDYVPVIDSFKGMASFFKKDSNYQDWLAGGGGMSSLVSLDRDYIQKRVFELSKETGLIDKAMNTIKNPLEIFKVMAEVVTSAPRLSEFEKARAAGKDIKTAAYDSRNVTLDNQRMGSDAAVKSLSMIKAFWNTHIQGVDRLVQSFKEDPKTTATKMGLAVTLPSVLLWARNHDDPRYKDLPEWQKDLFWIVTTKDHIYRIPKPFEQGILFGSSVERLLDAFYEHNPHAFKGFLRTVTEGAIPSPMPDFLSAPLEQFANKSFMTGGNIVPHSLEVMAPEYQYNPYTSETAKALGKMVSYIPGVRDVGSKNITLASPLVLQNYVRAWSGGMGQYALQLADKGLQTAGIVSPPPKPATQLEDLPFIKAFTIRYPSASSQSLQDFFENFDKTNTVFQTQQKLAKSGNFKALTDFMNSPQAKENMINLTGIERALGAQNQMIQKIYVNPEISPDAKRQQIDGIYYQMIQMSQFGNKLLEDVRNRKE